MFEVVARLKVRQGERDGFKQQAAELMRLTRERHAGPLRYDWFLSDDGSECEVREAFLDADALLEHQHYVADAKMKLFREFAGEHTMSLYGEPSPALEAALHAMGVPFKQFSLFQRLDVESKALEEVPA